MHYFPLYSLRYNKKCLPLYQTKVNLMVRKRKKYLVLDPKALGLSTKKKKDYYFRQTAFGYKLFFAKGLYIGYPKIIIETHDRLFKLVEDENKT